MRKIILSLAMLALIPSVYVAVAYADDDIDAQEEFYDEEEYEEEEEFVPESRSVVKRVTCDDIKKEMDALSADMELDEEGTERLATLKSDYRSKCMKRTGAGRRVAPKTKAVPSERIAITEKESSDSSSCDNPDKNGCCPGETLKDLGDLGKNCCLADGVTCFPPMNSEKPVKTCDDGGNPDKNGCCRGETLKDLGDLGFNCCLADGVTCFPPIKK